MMFGINVFVNIPAPRSIWDRKLSKTLSKTQVVHVFECHIRGNQVENWWVSKGPNTYFCPLYYYRKLSNTISGRWFRTFFIFPYIGNVIIPTDELIFFRGVGQPPTRYRKLTWMIQFHDIINGNS